MSTIEFSAEDVKRHLLEKNQANFYEIAWAVRQQVAEEILSKNQAASLSDILDGIEDHENRYHTRAETIKSDINSSIGEKYFYTGRVSVEASGDEPRDVAAEGYVCRSEAHANEVMRLVEKGAYGAFDTIVELGAGYGANLFRLRRKLAAPCRMVAAEITAAGRDFCTFLAALEGNEDAGVIETVAFDHRQPDLSFVEGSQSVLLITCHSLEQIQELPESFFASLAAAAPRVVGIHLEPFGFQVDGSTERAGRHRDFISNMGFNLNFYERLVEAERQGHLHVRHLELEAMAHHSENPTSLALWDNFPTS